MSTGPRLKLPMRWSVPAVLIGCAAILLGPGAALADDAPVITEGPVVTGLLQDGATLKASAKWTGTPEPAVAWRWRRCAGKGSCSAIKGASSDTYVATSADVGQTLRVHVSVTNAAGSDEKRSGPTDARCSGDAAGP